MSIIDPRGRRLRCYGIPDEMMYYAKRGVSIAVEVEVPLPDDAVRLNEWRDERRRCLMVVYEHPSFDLVPVGGETPCYIAYIRVLPPTPHDQEPPL